MIIKTLRLLPTQILVLGFASMILVGALLLTLPIASSSGESIGFLNALFEATSAVCVTGLVVVDTGDDLSLFGQLVIISLIQMGGLGFMTMATLVFLLLGKRITLRERLVIQEALNEFKLQGVVRLTRNIIGITFLIEGIGALILALRFVPLYGWGKGLYFSIFHAISAFCNAGFDLMGGYRSFTGFTDDFIVNFAIMGLIICGGLGFSVLLDIYRNKRFEKWSLHTKLVVCVTAILIVTGALFFFIVEFNNPATLGGQNWRGKILGALFQSVTPRTAGFNTIDQASLRNASKFMTIILMFIGASPAGTGGGIKTTTASVILLTVLSVIKGRRDVEVFNRRIPYSIVNRALAIAVISFIILVSVSMILSLIEPYPLVDVIFETASALGTVGLSTFNNSELNDISKIFVIMTMFAGRVGPLTLTLAFAKRLAGDNGNVKYPEGKVMVG
ncbi:trk system potassium uptake protein TrkH [Caldicoprobacter guelmensis]|uniref:TrkH family potassium uptake protein n=1 Tax=Caldicoprobacter guelmensis TaxID=1170224 RepID=UPI00195A12A2|nr:TrkH family potassium uptake protein [Caldicoprobacter guelmensis]MBM7582048.1 trk system potassium uptake protein TrkH [Caldicoprobacter guelmensis]